MPAVKWLTSRQAIYVYQSCRVEWQTEMRMKRLMPSLIAALLLAGAASSVLKSHVLFHAGQISMPSIKELQTGQASKLPELQMQDRSVLFAREPVQ